MTPFTFFAAAGWILAGIICLAVAVVIIYGVIVGIKNHADNRRRGRKYKIRNYKSKY